jgi:hypothetical protein
MALMNSGRFACELLILSAFMFTSIAGWEECNGKKITCDVRTPAPPGCICSSNPDIGCGLVCNTPKTQVRTTQSAQLAFTTTPPPLPEVCGYYYPPGSTEQTPCPSTYYCPETPSPIVPQKCPPGYYCDYATCIPVICPCGYKCPPGVSSPMACMAPFYCPDEGATNQTICPIGYKCPDQAMCVPIICPPGTFVTCVGKVSCDTCDAGRYCPTTTSNLICPAGNYCPPGSSAPTTCPEGFYCFIGSSAPTPCPSGYLCPQGCSIPIPNH